MMSGRFGEGTYLKPKSRPNFGSLLHLTLLRQAQRLACVLVTTGIPSSSSKGPINQLP